MADAKTKAATIAGNPLPPGPGGLGFDRLLHRIRDGVGFYEHLYRTCGDIVYFRMLSNRFCVVFDPALFQEVFVTKKSSFEVGPIFTRSGLLNDPSSGLTAEGDELKRTVTLASASFRGKAMNGYGEIMIEQALQAQAGWRDGESLTPPIYVTGRSALEDCTIGDYHVPKGTIVQLCWRIAHMSEKYFPEADTFRPERWLETKPPERPTYAYVPFGGGDHMCIGAGFAKLAAVLTLATLCQRWHFDVISPEFPEVNTTALFRLKNGLPVKLRARRP